MVAWNDFIQNKKTSCYQKQESMLLNRWSNQTTARQRKAGSRQMNWVTVVPNCLQRRRPFAAHVELPTDRAEEQQNHTALICHWTRKSRSTSPKHHEANLSRNTNMFHKPYIDKTQITHRYNTCLSLMRWLLETFIIKCGEVADTHIQICTSSLLSSSSSWIYFRSTYKWK